uniref:interferon-inducible GTPase 5-like n=1 Tax=Semicossyphus pulcher TaxID=241346 RepID=UPI0037E7ECDB
MGNRSGRREKQQEIKEEQQKKDQALAVAKIQEHLEKENKVALNIAITGESGSGKSTFINALRGIKDTEKGAAPTGSVETTRRATPYPHPDFPNVTLWDLPGTGTTMFPAANYLKSVKFRRYDFFIIISSERFRENDVKLAKEIQKQKKKFYFVRSKIDHNVHDEGRSKNVNAERTLAQIRDDCMERLQELGVQSPQVFLISSFDLHLYDFPLLEETLGRELPEYKRDALLLAMPNISLEMICKKKKAFRSKIKVFAALSAGVAGVPVPGLSMAVDIALLVGVVKQYLRGFGLDIMSLQRLANRIVVPVQELTNVIVSPLAGAEITTELVMEVLSQFSDTVILMAAEEGCKFIPVFGIPIAMGLSFVTTQQCLNKVLDMLADDACRVFNRALGLNPAE